MNVAVCRPEEQLGPKHGVGDSFADDARSDAFAEVALHACDWSGRCKAAEANSGGLSPGVRRGGGGVV